MTTTVERLRGDASGGLRPAGPARRAAAELFGTAALVTVVLGSGIRADALAPDAGTALLANSLASAVGLGLLIALLSPVSGGHLNPVVTLWAWWSASDRGRGAGRDALVRVGAQTAGAIAGAVVADAMFGRAPAGWSEQDRSAGHLAVGETVATAGLVFLIAGLRRSGRDRWTPLAVAAYTAAAIWFTSSGAFANPAATVGRSLSDSFAGIAPASVPAFVGAQVLGAVLGCVLAALLFGPPADAGPAPRRTARRVSGERKARWNAARGHRPEAARRAPLPPVAVSVPYPRDDREVVAAGGREGTEAGHGRLPGQHLVDPCHGQAGGPAEGETRSRGAQL